MTMKRNIFLLTFGLVLLMFSQVYAGIIWDGEQSSFIFEIGNPEYGTFINNNVWTDIEQIKEANVFNQVISGSKRIKVNDTTMIRFQAGAKGPLNGISPGNGLEVATYAGITFADDFNCQSQALSSTKQIAKAITTREFMVDSPGDYNFDALFDGNLTYTNQNYDGHYAQYNHTVEVTLDGFVNGDTGPEHCFGTEFILNETSRAGHEIVSLLADDGNGDSIYYVLMGKIVLSSDLDNYDLWAEVFTSPEGINFENSSLGTLNDPLELSASLSPVPLPGSLVLLFSGLGGLAVIRNRCKKK